MLKVDNLCVRIKKKEIISNLSCELDAGVHGLLGPNGAGKTTVMRGMLGLYPQAKGTVTYKGKPLLPERVGYLPQKFGLFPNMTIKEALFYLGSMMKLSKDKLDKEIERVLEEVNLTDKINCKISTLSGGMVRRVGIAQAFLGEPDIVMLDEPTAGLDPEERLRFQQLIKSKKGKSIIIISTHIVDDIEYLSDYVTIINEGKLLKQDTCDNLRLCAEGKVVKVPYEHAVKGESDFDFVVREYKDNTGVGFRVLTGSGNEYERLEPSLEDGYLCVLKDI